MGQLTCSTCYVQFSVSDEHERKLRQCHNTFYCPSGHSIWFPGETDKALLDKANGQIVGKNREIDYLSRSNVEMKNRLEKIEKRRKYLRLKQQERRSKAKKTKK